MSLARTCNFPTELLGRFFGDKKLVPSTRPLSLAGIEPIRGHN